MSFHDAEEPENMDEGDEENQDLIKRSVDGGDVEGRRHDGMQDDLGEGCDRERRRASQDSELDSVVVGDTPSSLQRPGNHESSMQQQQPLTSIPGSPNKKKHGIYVYRE